MSMLMNKNENGIEIHEIYEKYLQELREVTGDKQEIVPCFTERELAKLLYGKKTTKVMPDDSSKGWGSVHMTGLKTAREKERRDKKMSYAPLNGGSKHEEATLGFEVTPRSTSINIILDDRSIRVVKELVETEDGLKPEYTEVEGRKLGESEYNAFYNKSLKLEERDGEKKWRYTDRKVDLNYCQIIYEWYHLVEAWFTYDNNIMTNSLEGFDNWSKNKSRSYDVEIDTNNMDNKINAYLVNSVSFSPVNSIQFTYDDVYPNFRSVYEEIDEKYDEIERQEAARKEALKEVEETDDEHTENIGKVDINDYIRWKKAREERPLSNEQLSLLGEKLKFLKEHNMPITEEQEKLIKRAEENGKMLAFEEKINRFREAKEARERALAEKKIQIRAHNKEIEERINKPDSYVKDREDYFNDMKELLEGLKTIQQIDSGLLSKEQQTTLNENEKFFEMRDLSSKERHIRDEGMSDIVREWYRNEYTETSRKGKSK